MSTPLPPYLSNSLTGFQCVKRSPCRSETWLSDRGLGSKNKQVNNKNIKVIHISENESLPPYSNLSDPRVLFPGIFKRETSYLSPFVLLLNPNSLTFRRGDLHSFRRVSSGDSVEEWGYSGDTRHFPSIYVSLGVYVSLDLWFVPSVWAKQTCSTNDPLECLSSRQIPSTFCPYRDVVLEGLDPGCRTPFSCARDLPYTSLDARSFGQCIRCYSSQQKFLSVSNVTYL